MAPDGVDMKCNFQIFQDDTWKDCALLTLLDRAGGNPRTSCIFEYDLDYRFGQQLIALEQHMRQAGVDDDIVTFLKPHIAVQIQQLQSLGGDEYGAN
jgi:hypothetical protein